MVSYMRVLFFSLVTVAVAVVLCLLGCGGFAGKAPETVTIRDVRSPSEVRVISDEATITSLTERMKRAPVVSGSRPKSVEHYTHKLVLGDTWFYDKKSGRFTLLAVMDEPEHEMLPEDRRWMDGLLEKR